MLSNCSTSNSLLGGGVWNRPAHRATKHTPMQRFCVRHTYRGSSRAHRLILARHSLDRDAHQLVVDEYDGCPQCWRDTCLAAVDAANSLLASSSGSLPELDGHGTATA